MNITIGTKIQRKGSKVVWTVTGHNNMALPEGKTFGALTVDKGIEGATELHISCVPKNRTTSMSDWVSVENINKNWVEVK